MELYGYWRSSASYRARIALNYKQIDYHYIPVHLIKEGGQQHKQAYRQLNPNGLVPTLVDGKVILHQSLAIMEYLEDTHPQPSLLPGNAQQRGAIRALALDIASELQPLINLRVQQYLSQQLEVSDNAKQAWLQHWFKQSFQAFERNLEEVAGVYCVGDQFSMADVCLVPQVYSAQRFGIALDDYPIMMGIYQRLLELPCVAAAHPSKQPDAEV
ncbi:MULTISPECIES: maleylacetoacetate isomerase [Idiomarina]|uniref:maleylacetoacetate isomerase n=1 Tax=Idiomarina TaxID=135575 RepID=UPI00129C0D81|nr:MULTISPECIES: maleylacetoacetate isomerase [Idiomarina]MRJ40931.1 maleylacetoacetate isomerase [Idiomarina sp. FeN1]NCU56735.1 maleylacetoacetate isomerase [Idiomarina sp. FenA--70]NCU59115.1 maleylacetoacetate isomerase [Idiomarina sp. FenBw--71]UUN14394.1 maleylacetoacetate isomerase [Idiomarina loihiensis]